MITRAIAWLAFAAAWLAAPTAGATGNFPNAVQRDLQLSYSPPCSLCHVGGVTGNGTVQTPFGKSMRARGLVALDENALKGALDRMAQDKVDSDHDGVPDIDELKAGSDPNVAGPGVTYGCSAGPRPAANGALWLAACAAALVYRRRRQALKATA